MSDVELPRLLVVTGGHPFEREPFIAMFDAIAPGRWTHAEQPDASESLNPAACSAFDVIVFYDLPGLRFTRSDPPTEMPLPPQSVQDGFVALLAEGKAMVFLHHAIAGWPAWETYAHIVGGRYHYQPGILDGVSYPDSGYLFDVTHRVEVLDPDHPMCAGLGDGFELTDELYLYPVLTESVVPLLRTTFPMDDPSRFYSPNLAIRGKRNSNEGWTHVAEGSAINYRNNPPASGPHYPVWLRWAEYSQVIPRGYWVHNLEHGGIIVLYRPDAPAEVIRQITDAYRAIPDDPLCGHKRAALVPDPQLPRLTAVVAADYALPGDTVDAAAVRAFAVARRGHGPEQLCDQGSRP